MYNRICIVCGKPFETTNYNRKCCTNICSIQRRNQIEKRAHKRHGEYKTKSDRLEFKLHLCYQVMSQEQKDQVKKLYDEGEA